MKNYRQGDVLLIGVPDSSEYDVEPAPKDPRGMVLAEGETSNHFHSVFGNGCKLFRFRDASGQQLLVTGKRGADLRVVGGGAGGVDRHLPIAIEPGKYVIRTQRAWSSAHLARRVED